MNDRSDAPLPLGPAAGGNPLPLSGAAPDPAALAEFLASLAHDLRSQLGVVTGVLAELGADFASQLTDEQRLLLTLGNRSLGRFRRIADMASLASALDSGTLELHRTPVDLVGLLRSAAGVAAALQPRRGMDITCDLPAAPCSAVVDADRMARAVSELLINALRHARRSVRLRLEAAPAEVRVTTEDDGQGVPEELRPSLFLRFAPRPAHSGLGMGLSIAHDLIAAHGGRLALEGSTLPPGRPGTTGARFVISLPLAVLG